MSNEKFNWYNFYKFANNFSTSNDSASLRSGISRMYYSAFCMCRDFILSNKYFIDDENKSIMKSKSSQVHEETVKCFMDNNPHFNSNSDRKAAKKIGSNLIDVRKRRNKADYQTEKYDEKWDYDHVKSRVEIIFENIEKL